MTTNIFHMKYVYSICICFLIFGCRLGNSSDSSRGNTSTSPKTTMENNMPKHASVIVSNKNMLIGYWALVKDSSENAVFELQRDSILYADQEVPAMFRYVIENDSFKVFQSGYLACSRIVFADSNLFITVGNNYDTTKYFRKTS